MNTRYNDEQQLNFGLQSCGKVSEYRADEAGVVRSDTYLFLQVRELSGQTLDSQRGLTQLLTGQIG